MTHTNFYFVSNSEMIIAINGRYGFYAKLRGYNFSEKAMRKMGYELRNLTDAEVELLRSQINERNKALKEEAHARMLEAMATQVNICLADAPLAIGNGNDLWKHITTLEGAHRDVYTGCGLATAYIVNEHIIAWHYGNESPANAPECDYVQRCEVSCGQMLF